MFQADGLHLEESNQLNTSHSQRLNSGKPLGIGRCVWWYPIEPCPNGTLPFQAYKKNLVFEIISSPLTSCIFETNCKLFRTCDYMTIS